MPFVLLVVIAWLYVAVMMAVVEATSSTGTLLGALVTFMFYGVLPLTIVLYLLNTPARRRARRASQQVPPISEEPAPAARSAGPLVEPDQSGHAAGAAVPPVREEP